MITMPAKTMLGNLAGIITYSRETRNDYDLSESD